MSLAARGLVTGYGRSVVGAGLDLAVARGEVVMLLGPNGCGKSTLFRTLLGLLPRLGGEVTVDGEPAERLGRRGLARRLAHVPQSATGFFPYSVLETVLMGRTPHLGLFAAPGAADREQAAAALAALGLEALAGRAFTRLSGGQRQLVLIARALAQQAPFIVMDEPTASLDFGNRVRVLEVIADLAGRATGVLVASHDPDQAFLVADRVLVMQDGGIAAAGPPQAVLTEERLARTYGVPVRVGEVRDAAGKVRGRACLPAWQPRTAERGAAGHVEG